MEVNSKGPEGKILRERVESEAVSAMASLSMRYPENSTQSINENSGSRRRSSDSRMSEDVRSDVDVIRRSNSNLRGDSEEPMDQDESK